MKKAKGYVDYSVRVDCPHCEKVLNLNDYPYTDEGGKYGRTEDELGNEVFGTPDKAAKWNGFEIEYKCHGCKEKFLVTELEI